MTLTTDPRAVAAGRVRVSNTNRIKRDALIGRAAQFTLYESAHKGTVVVGTITKFVNGYPILLIHRDKEERRTESLKGRWVRLDSVVHLVDECGTCHYSSPATAGHWTFCPLR